MGSPDFSFEYGQVALIGSLNVPWSLSLWISVQGLRGLLVLGLVMRSFYPCPRPCSCEFFSSDLIVISRPYLAEARTMSGNAGIKVAMLVYQACTKSSDATEVIYQRQYPPETS
jgi:hypothetical protein